MNNVSSYTCRSLELRAAQYYASIRKPKDEWKTIDDLTPQLAEFEHRLCSQNIKEAFEILESVDRNYLSTWGYYERLAQMRQQLQKYLIDPGQRSMNLSNLGFVHYAMGHIEHASQLYTQALSIAQGINVPYLEAHLHNSLGKTYQILGQIKLAMLSYKKSLAISRVIGDQQLESSQYGNLGSVNFTLGKIGEATKFYRYGLAIAREMEDSGNTVLNLHGLGLIYQALGQFEEAIELYEEAMKINQKIGNRRSECILHNCIGIAHQSLGDFRQAIRCHEVSLEIARGIHEERAVSYALTMLGRALLSIGAISEAFSCCTAAIVSDIPDIQYNATLVLGITMLHQSDPNAKNVFAEAITQSKSLLSNAVTLYRPRYSLATALAGFVVATEKWKTQCNRHELLIPSLKEYRKAIKMCSAPGVVKDVICDLELIRAAGIDGLEPAFVLLEQAIADWQPLPGDALPSPTSLQENTV